ncbi:multicopper oxidase domain-containing protein [Mycobacterium asiaticum]|uniref:Copper oxidase n=1 Tax=Mycobacterium asiaticum TaxID=1790 RepID=A0A1A3NUN9_MYCAS|nr:multicopper oxidase domain-containing protein [Mycobacterium asiaticum]OBK24047.1 copper oxidase [Mycobacterium asiaticum]
MTLSCSPRHNQAHPEIGVNAGKDGHPADFKEPVRLSSKDGVLEVRLSAHQGTVNLDTVKEPVTNFLVYGYELMKGTSSDGSTKGDNVYPAPTLRVNPGERLIVHYDNDLQGLTIADFNDPSYVPVNEQVPLFPPALTSSPLNLHTHGLHVSPSGNADNVLLNIPAGMGNTYDYPLPKNMPQGLYWYHSHRHMLTALHTYLGLAGLLEIGRPDGALPLVTKNNIPIRDMALQYNFVFDRKNGGHQLNNPYWEQWVNTLKPPEGNQLADGTYPSSLAPVNFAQTSKGAQYISGWHEGPLSVDNKRGANQFIPMNLQSFTSPTVNVPADPGLPDNQRDVQFTVNGQFQPRLKIKPGQTEIWVLANISDIAYMSMQLTETATGNHPKFAIVGQDGNPCPTVQRPVDGDGSLLFIPPASRFAIAVTMPKTGDLVLEMPPMQGGKPRTSQAVLYTNNGAKTPPAVLGELNVEPRFVSYADGFFAYPTQTLIRATADNGEGRTTVFEPGMELNSPTSFRDDSVRTPDYTRELTISGGFGNNYASKSDAKAFTYQFDGNIFPNIPLIQPRLNTMEEWRIVNYNNDGHPMHIHVNDYQVMQVVNPTANTTTGVQMFSVDTANVPPPIVDAYDNATAPSSLTFRTEFEEFGGTYVIHCHRLNHEDNGLMATVNVIPQVSTYAVGVPGRPGFPAAVQVLDGNGDKVITTVTPFPAFEGAPSVAMADVNGDTILDLVVGTGAGVAPEVVVYTGADAFKTELARFAPFDAGFKGGVNVAAANIDANPMADNIIVGTGPGVESEVKVFSSKLPAVGKAPEVFSSFKPYPGSQTGVTVTTGLVSYEQGRQNIITAPGPGGPAQVKVFRYDLFTPTARSGGPSGGPGAPALVTEFSAFDAGYTGGISLATGWVAGEEGGAQSIITGQLADRGTVRVWSSGSRLDGAPVMYTHSPDAHSGHVMFRQTASFEPFVGAGAVTVATTSTVTGADLLVSAAGRGGAEVRKYSLARAGEKANTLAPRLIGPVSVASGSVGAAPLGGR